MKKNKKNYNLYSSPSGSRMVFPAVKLKPASTNLKAVLMVVGRLWSFKCNQFICQVGQIQFAIKTNTIGNLDKYRW